MEFQVKELGVVSSRPGVGEVARRVVSGEREPAGRPPDEDGPVLDLGTGYGIDLEAAEQGVGVKRGGCRPQWPWRRGSGAPATVRRQGGTGGRLGTWGVDARRRVAGGRGGATRRR